MYAPSADFSCFLNCVQNPALKLLPDWEFFEEFLLRGSGNFFLKIILRSRVFLVVLKYCSDVLRFLRHCEKSAQVTYVNVRSQRGLFLFLELRAKSRLKTIAGLEVLGGGLLYCLRSDVLRFLRHNEKSAQVTYVNVRSQRGLFLFLELRAKSRLKTIAGLGVFGELFFGGKW